MRIQLKPWSASSYAWATGAVVAGLGLHFYYMREMLASLALFSLLFLSLGLVALGIFLACYAGNQAAIWAGPASRVVLTIFQRQERVVEFARIPEGGWRLADSRSDAETQTHVGRKP